VKIVHARPDTTNMGRSDTHRCSVRAFSLVELVIVVAVLGILGAMVAGRFGQTADQARQAAQKVDANSVRAAIARYQADHGGASPAFSTLADQLTRPTNYAGDVGATKNAEYRFGPYLPKMPDLNIQQLARSGVSTSPSPGDVGDKTWYYCESSGRLQPSDKQTEPYAAAILGNVEFVVD
jgi:prepilin-type N-terminal cleavage/methylation domain-containing protein